MRTNIDGLSSRVGSKSLTGSRRARRERADTKRETAAGRGGSACVTYTVELVESSFRN